MKGVHALSGFTDGAVGTEVAVTAAEVADTAAVAAS